VRLGAHRITATVLVAIVDCEVTRARRKCLRRLVYSPAALRKCHRSDGGQPHARCDECGGACAAATIARHEDRAPTTTPHVYVCESTAQMNALTHPQIAFTTRRRSPSWCAKNRANEHYLECMHVASNTRSLGCAHAHTLRAPSTRCLWPCGSLVTDKILM